MKEYPDKMTREQARAFGEDVLNIVNQVLTFLGLIGVLVAFLALILIIFSLVLPYFNPYILTNDINCNIVL